jgi:hypothetical protein
MLRRGVFMRRERAVTGDVRIVFVLLMVALMIVPAVVVARARVRRALRERDSAERR